MCLTACRNNSNRIERWAWNRVIVDTVHHCCVWRCDGQQLSIREHGTQVRDWLPVCGRGRWVWPWLIVLWGHKLHSYSTPFGMHPCVCHRFVFVHHSHCLAGCIPKHRIHVLNICTDLYQWLHICGDFLLENDKFGMFNVVRIVSFYLVDWCN